MPRPKVVHEVRRKFEERPPPPVHTLRPHRWLSRDSRLSYDAVVHSGRSFDLYISRSAEEVMRSHASREAPKRLEVMGFMLGDVSSWQGDMYATVLDVVTTDLNSTPSKVRFDRDALPKLFGDLDGSGFDYIIVGWYHSHPGHTCFLSKTDLETQRTMFDQPYHTAFVIDPLNEEAKAFRLSGQRYDEVSFAITDALMPARARSKRKRKLRSDPAPGRKGFSPVGP